MNSTHPKYKEGYHDGYEKGYITAIEDFCKDKVIPSKFSFLDKRINCAILPKDAKMEIIPKTIRKWPRG
jgi:hypothetical protein